MSIRDRYNQGFMNLIETQFKDLLIIEPKVFEFERGYFFESFNLKNFKEKSGLEVSFVQDNQSVPPMVF